MRISRPNAMRIAAGVAMVLTLASSALGANPNSARRHAALRQPAPAPLPVVPPGPLPPLTMEQEPTSLPQVSYHGGQLTIAAQNSTLGDVLRAVRTQTGAAMEVPGNPNDRVIGHFGPGPARDVLAALLNGSRFNYVLLGSASNPNALERVILTSQSGGSAPPPEPQSPEQAQQPQPGGFGDAEPADEMGTLDPGNREEEPDTDLQAADGQAVQSDDNVQQPGTPPQGVRSPQQLLQELQQRQQQQQQPGQLFQGVAPAPGSPIQQQQ